MNVQRALLLIALVSGLAAGTLYHLAMRRTDVVVAAHDLEGGRPIERDELALRSFPLEVVPSGAVRELSEVIGSSLRSPLGSGQLVLRSTIGDDGSPFESGLRPPLGTRAVALPVAVAHALGGAVVPGTRVDVIAVPAPGRAPAGRQAELIAVAALVLDVRSDVGTPFGRPKARSSMAVSTERLGSVVVAIPSADELRVADRIATSTLVLVLASAN